MLASMVGPSALARDASPGAVVLIVTDGPTPIPDRLAARAARFTRCYSADPERGRGRAAIRNGRFPHLGGLTGDPGGAPVFDVLQAAGLSCSMLAQPVFDVADNTLLVITATRSGDDEAWFDKSTHVPLLFCWPRRIAPAELDLLASTVDVMPTILSLCGVSKPEGLQGVDLSPWLLGGRANRPESIYAEGRIGTRQSWRMIVRGLDKLVFTPRLDVLHLYNLGQDPGEATDLSGEISEERRLDELRAIAADWMRRLGDRTDPSGLKRR
jgi:arylsulfatase A-like enzyme